MGIFKKPKTNCDICEVEFYQEDLINIDPDSDNEYDIKEEYEYLNGMVCENCFANIIK